MMLNDQKYREIINEWFAHLDKGYALEPYTKHERAVLSNVLRRHNIQIPTHINEANEINADDSQVTQKEYQDLLKKLNDVSERYAKYLTVFHYFAPDSLGTISEVLLSKLLDGTHTGGAQGLTDLRVGNINISLKTTAASHPINLGSKDNKTMSERTFKIVNDYINEYGQSNNLEQMIAIANKSGDAAHKAAFDEIEHRLEAVAEKLAGPDNNEYFLWASKVYNSNKILTKLRLYLIKFEKATVLNDLLKGNMYATNVAWGVRTAGGTTIIQADKGSKYLNVHPAYVAQVKPDPTEIDLLKFNITQSETGEDKLTDRARLLVTQLQSKANDAFFKYLDMMYKEIINQK